LIMNYFPAFRTAHYSDEEGFIHMAFTPDYSAEFTYSILFRGKLLNFDHLDELFPQLPVPGKLSFILPLEFCHITGGSNTVEFNIIISSAPKDRSELIYQCNFCIDNHFYRTAEFSENATCASESGLEGALVQTGKLVKSAGYFRICFFCKHSDYEPNTSFGHLYCFVKDKEIYSKIASSSSNRDKKYSIWNLNSTPVDEFHSSDGFEPRPPDWGYRG